MNETNVLPIAQKVSALLNLFHDLEQWEDRYKLIIQIGKDMPPMDSQFLAEEFKVKGCQSQVWLHASLADNGRIHFQGESDAAITKGIIGMLLQIYNQATPEEVLSVSPDFLNQIGLRDHLSMNRSNGLTSMLKQINYYALAFKIKLSMAKEGK